jgi:DinB superfamily
MADRLPHIITRLTDEGAATLDFFRGLPPDVWAQQVYDIGPEWDVREVLCHFVSAEESLAKLFVRIVATGEGVSDDFDVDRWNASKVSKMNDMTATELIEEFNRLRAATVAWAATLAEDDLDKVGRHPFLGMDRVENMLKLLYRHTMLHLRDVRKALDTGQPVPPSD